MGFLIENVIKLQSPIFVSFIKRLNTFQLGSWNHKSYIII